MLCCREVFFETNGVPRTVEIVDTRDQGEGGGPIRKAAREKALPDVLGSVGAPMAGEVIEVTAKPGQHDCCNILSLQHPLAFAQMCIRMLLWHDCVPPVGVERRPWPGLNLIARW